MGWDVGFRREIDLILQTDTSRHKEWILLFFVKSPDLIFSLEQISHEGADKTDVEEEEEGEALGPR